MPKVRPYVSGSSDSEKTAWQDSHAREHSWLRQLAGTFPLTAQFLGKIIFPQSAVESSVGVTPVNYFYLPGDLRRYGGVGDGSTDSTSQITNWLKVVVGGEHGVIPNGTFVYNGQLSLNLSPSTSKNGIVIDGYGVGSSIIKVVTSSSPAFKISGGSTALFYSVFRSFNVSTNLNGIGLQLGEDSFSDALNTFRFENISVNNNNNSSLAIAVRANQVLNSFMHIIANAGGTSATAALQCRQVQFSIIAGSHSNAGIGEHITSGFNFGNHFQAVDIEVVGTCVRIDSASAARNTWTGGQFVWSVFGVTATNGGNNEFWNPNPGTSVATFFDTGAGNRNGISCPEVGLGSNQFGGVNVNPLTGDGSVILNSLSGNTSNVAYQRATSLRWQIQRNNSAESGGNAGSDLQFIAIADDGVTNLGNYLVLTRANALATFKSSISVGGTATISPANATCLVCSPSAGDSAITINSVAGNSSLISFQRASSLRWQVVRNNSSESGANAGSNLQITAFADDGVTNLGNYVAITRSSGSISLKGALGVNGNSAPAQTTGWGTPTGNSVVTNFNGSLATLLQTSEVVAQIITDLKAIGFYGS